MAWEKKIDIKTLTVMCICGCKALTQIPCAGLLQAELYQGHIIFRWKFKFINWVFKILPSKKSLIVMIETIEGKRFCTSNVPLNITWYGMYATASWIEQIGVQ